MNLSMHVIFGLVIPLLVNSSVEILRPLMKDVLIEICLIALLVLQKNWTEVKCSIIWVWVNS